MTLKTKTVNAVKWSYFSLFTQIALQLVFAAILSRLLSPAAFGVVAQGLVLQRFGMFISDFGVGTALVQKPVLTKDDVRAAFTSSLGLGLLVTVLAWLLAPLAGQFYRSAELVPVFRGFALTYVCFSSIVVSTSILRRALRFRPLVIAELSAYILGHGVIGLTAAYLGYGAMSLAISAVAQVVIQLVVVYSAARHSLTPIFNWSAYKGIYSFGSRLTVATFLEFTSSVTDVTLLSRWLNTTAVGLYNRAYNTVGVPAMSFAGSLTRVLSPSFSSIQTDKPRLRRAYLSGMLALTLVMFCASGCIFIDAREVVMVMLGKNFTAAVPLVQLFALLIPFSVLSNLTGVLADATATLNAKIAVQASYLAMLLLAFFSVHWIGGGLYDFALVLVLGTVARNIAFAFLARRILAGGGWQIIRTYLIGLTCWAAAALVSLAVTVPLRHLGTPLPVLFVVEVLLGGVLVLAAVLLGPPNELQNMARRVIQGLTSRAGRWLAR